MEDKETITQEISIPEGCVLDEEKSTLLHLVFKKKPKEVKVWEDIDFLDGCLVSESSKIEFYTNQKSCPCIKNLARTDTVAKSMLAMAQISQLMPFYGGEITNEEWHTSDVVKWTIYYSWTTKVFVLDPKFTFQYDRLLAFRTEKQAEEFIKNNPQLLKDYFMVD